MTISQSAQTVRMPALGDSVGEGTITRWLKEPGERVEAEEPLLEVATDKVDTEIPSPVGGTLLEVLAAEDDVVAIGADLALIGPDVELPQSGCKGASAPESPALVRGLLEAPLLEHVRPDAEGAYPQPTGPSTRPPQRPAASDGPSVRSAPPGTLETVTERLPRIRRTIAARMVDSLQTAAQLTTVLEVDVTAIADLRRARKDEFHSRVGVKLSFLPFFAKAAVSSLADHRVLNASVSADVTEIAYHGRCHLGIAVDSDKGLMVPVIRDAQDLSIEGLARAIADKAERVRAGTIAPDELGGGTFTLTNTGSRGALFDTPIINQPQTAILGTGAVVERVIPTRRDGALSLDVRSMAYLSISYDHRVVDGADAARFLTAIKNRLEGEFDASDLG